MTGCTATGDIPSDATALSVPLTAASSPAAPPSPPPTTTPTTNTPPGPTSTASARPTSNRHPRAVSTSNCARTRRCPSPAAPRRSRTCRRAASHCSRSNRSCRRASCDNPAPMPSPLTQGVTIIGRKATTPAVRIPAVSRRRRTDRPVPRRLFGRGAGRAPGMDGGGPVAAEPADGSQEDRSRASASTRQTLAAKSTLDSRWASAPSSLSWASPCSRRPSSISSRLSNRRSRIRSR